MTNKDGDLLLDFLAQDLAFPPSVEVLPDPALTTDAVVEELAPSLVLSLCL